MVEPWLRGTLTDIDAVRRQVLHALELAEEDCVRWAGGLTAVEVDTRPFGMASVGFHLRHIARSLDRLLTYAEGRALNDEQLAALRTEMSGPGPLAELQQAIQNAKQRVINISPETFQQVRTVGRAGLPSTVGGLLVHSAEHTQRHVGQIITTSKVVIAMRAA